MHLAKKDRGILYFPTNMKNLLDVILSHFTLELYRTKQF